MADSINLKENFQNVEAQLQEGVLLVAVSKTKPNELIQEAYNLGYRDFGENKVQDLAAKAEVLPQDINWHFIGHLQTNKVKYIAPFVHLIHSIDSLKLLKEVQKRAASNDRTISVLLQGAISEEDTKFGWDLRELSAFLKNEEWRNYPNVSVIGLMGMASNTSDEELVKREFKSLRSFRDEHSSADLPLKDLSMGMSGDFKLAMAEGSTMVRIGSSLFGARNY
jgi:pyridoxal phosphate enzyme (YggS family)